jgi:hypothetical protein
MAMENLAVDGANAAVDARKWGIGPESKRERERVVVNL